MKVSLQPLSGRVTKEIPPFLQAEFWSNFKKGFGWTSLPFLLTSSPDAPIPLTIELRVLVRALAGPFCFAYVPWGPAVGCPGAFRSELLTAIGRELRAHLPALCLFVRFDPPWYDEEEPATRDETLAETRSPRLIARPRFSLPLRKARSDVQPPDSVLLSIDRGENDILASMKPKWRYNIKLAAKKGVSVADEGTDGIPVFYRLYEETSKRDRIAIHPLAYYRKLFDTTPGLAGSPDLRLWIARHEGEPIAAIITLFFGETATYLYGASSDVKRSLMPSYALQWAAIRAAREKGCRIYDLYGIPPADDPGHPMAGLYRFKTGFGGRVVHYAGSWDLPFSPLLYGIWTMAESLRAFWFKDLRKRLGRPARSTESEGVRASERESASVENRERF